MSRYNVLGLTLVTLSLPLSAADAREASLWDSNRLYLGGTVGVAHSGISQQRVTDRFAGLGYDFDVELEDRTRGAWGALAGYQWSRHFATEIGFVDMGGVTALISGQPSRIQDYLDSGADALPQSLSGWELAALGHYPLGEHYYLYARAGVMFSRVSTRAESLSDQDWQRSAEGPSLGLGVGYRFDHHWRARLGLSYYDLDQQRTTLAGLSLIYQLGQPAERPTRTPAPMVEPAPERPDRTEPAPSPASYPDGPSLALTFAYNSHAVGDEFVGRLAEVAEQLHDDPKLRLQLTGHADSWGPSDYNQALSVERAEAVRDFMVEAFELAPERFEVRGYGDQRPFVNNDTPEGRSMNRRVILEWLEP
ncbi:OmpA family protein [Marinimicrobium alkaliphilum]|uniref:OmpA family protein n=1 Tax=Marinimicrobium alkaliphilum TaxID=2202654 RepID=UPI000DB90039|nr:OmpA family protein [Marinimicrobium alkaliphilum]